ncbi:hypothetical protein P885DRAFT_75181 [Corynascus similis CBS 632.67]
MAPPLPARPLIKGPLRAPQQSSTFPSYTVTSRLKSEIEVHMPGSSRVSYKEVSLTEVPQPFVNPSDAFSQLKASRRGPNES